MGGKSGHKNTVFYMPFGCGSIGGVQNLDKNEGECHLRGTKPAKLRILREFEIEAPITISCIEPKGQNKDRNK